MRVLTIDELQKVSGGNDYCSGDHGKDDKHHGHSRSKSHSHGGHDKKKHHGHSMSKSRSHSHRY